MALLGVLRELLLTAGAASTAAWATIAAMPACRHTQLKGDVRGGRWQRTLYHRGPTLAAMGRKKAGPGTCMGCWRKGQARCCTLFGVETGMAGLAA